MFINQGKIIQYRNVLYRVFYSIGNGYVFVYRPNFWDFLTPVVMFFRIIKQPSAAPPKAAGI